MADDRLRDEVATALVVERAVWHSETASTGRLVVEDAQTRLQRAIERVGRSGDLDAILGAERDILDNEREHFANSPEMRGSLDTALAEFEVLSGMVERVRDPLAYRAVDEVHRLPRNRVSGVPRDEARRVLDSHRARLSNLQRARSGDLEKSILAARQSNIAQAKRLYADLQHAALEVARPASPSPEPAP